MDAGWLFFIQADMDRLDEPGVSPFVCSNKPCGTTEKTSARHQASACDEMASLKMI
ncbi:hypothetical protein DESC_820032 [Desulfosarcina cetonica]|nr:hypothetical protein DESC_820032 [Desulfosarcina cetonica]